MQCSGHWRRVQEVRTKHIQQEQVQQLLQAERGTQCRGSGMQQGNKEDLQVRVPLRGTRMGLLKSSEPYEEMAASVVRSLRRWRVDVFC